MKTPLYEYIKDNWRVWGQGVQSFADDYGLSRPRVNNWITRLNKEGGSAYVENKTVYSSLGAPLLDLTIRVEGYVPTISECRGGYAH